MPKKITEKSSQPPAHLPDHTSTKHSASCFGRTWQACPSGSTLVKIACVALVTAVCFTPTATNSPLQGECLTAARAPTALSSAFENLACPVSSYEHLLPACEHGYQTLSKRLSNFMNNGMVLIGKGSTGCQLESDMSWFKSCPTLINITDEFVKNSGPAFIDHIFSEMAFAEKGAAIPCLVNEHSKKDLKLNPSISLSQLQSILGLNPEKMTRHQNAVALTEKLFLGNQAWYASTDQQFLDFFKELHRTLTKGVFSQLSADELRPGKYRNMEVIVKHDPMIDAATIPTYLQSKAGATPQQIELYINSLHKIGSCGFQGLTKTELAVWRMFAFIPPMPNEIAPLMTTFVANLKEKALQEIHPIELAAWAHCEFGRIHPFSDGNGRIARLLMNGILAHAGHRPLIIPNDAEYTQAVNADGATPGAFARYLAEQVIPWNQQQQPYLEQV